MKNMIKLSFLLYCFLIVCALLYYQYFDIPINSIALKWMVFSIPAQCLGLLLGILLYRINAANQKLVLSPSNNANRKIYRNSKIAIGIYIGIALFSLVLPTAYGFFIELPIMECIGTLVSWIEELFFTHLNIMLPLNRLFDLFCLRSALLFLAVYFFCELHFTKVHDEISIS